MQELEIAAAEAIEKYAHARTKSLALAEESMFELIHSGVDHDEPLMNYAQALKKLATKSLEDVLDERASAIQRAKETFGDGTTLRFYPGVMEVVHEGESISILGEMLTEEEASGVDQEAP